MKNRISIKARDNLRKLVRLAQQLYDNHIDPFNLGEANEY